ncbi:hypothetical protein [Algoriphagus taiwanensis]|uniref:Acetyltransferase (GNAT) domain-containing protein n=1 Tax=Algoriphagus taiwanensis TaxID=1445656 RepID=A0ABQ6Q2D5_9BACT|nr:hypothetical protein Ataiwa_19100 [Algoriphagus taiwanensis]
MKQTISETKKTLEANKTEGSSPYLLRVVPANEGTYSYFLRQFAVPGFSELLDFQWVKKDKVKAGVTFALTQDGRAVSLPKAPFGGVWTEEKLSSSSLEAFLNSVIENLQVRNIRNVQLVQPPKPYGEQTDLINYLLSKSGFQAKEVVSHHFHCGKKKIKKFAQDQQIKWTSKIKENGLKILLGPIQNFGFLEEIRSWNLQKGYSVTFDEARLIQQVSEFPERYFLVSILKNKQAIAHALGVKLTEDSLYYFLSAINPKSEVKNLGDLILAKFFFLASELKVNWVDLGSSDLPEGPNHNLIHFKSRFSNDISIKITWSRTI